MDWRYRKYYTVGIYRPRICTMSYEDHYNRIIGILKEYKNDGLKIHPYVYSEEKFNDETERRGYYNVMISFLNPLFNVEYSKYQHLINILRRNGCSVKEIVQKEV